MGEEDAQAAHERAHRLDVVRDVQHHPHVATRDRSQALWRAAVGHAERDEGELLEATRRPRSQREAQRLVAHQRYRRDGAVRQPPRQQLLLRSQGGVVGERRVLQQVQRGPREVAVQVVGVGVAEGRRLRGARRVEQRRAGALAEDAGHVGQRHDGAGSRRPGLRHDDGLRRLGAQQHRRAALEDARLLARDQLARGAEDLLVVELHRGHDREHRGGNDVRGVQAAAETHLEHERLAAAVAVAQKGQRRRHFEERGGDVVLNAQPHHAREEGLHLFLRHEGRVHLDALAEGRDVRRDEQPRPQALRRQATGDLEGNRAFSVRPSDVDDGNVVEGSLEEVVQPLHVLQAELHGVVHVDLVELAQ